MMIDMSEVKSTVESAAKTTIAHMSTFSRLVARAQRDRWCLGPKLILVEREKPLVSNLEALGIGDDK